MAERRSTRAKRGLRSMAMLTAGLVMAAGLATAAPAAAQSKKDSEKATPAKEAKALPPLPTDEEPKVKAEAMKGDFSDPPAHPDQPDQARRAPKAAFDPALSKVLDAETTPTKKTYANPDGSRTDILTKEPTRYRDAKGAWVDIDLTPTPAADGTPLA